jgi:hypothetical protein
MRLCIKQLRHSPSRLTTLHAPRGFFTVSLSLGDNIMDIILDNNVILIVSIFPPPSMGVATTWENLTPPPVRGGELGKITSTYLHI